MKQPIKTVEDAIRFIRSAQFALRYNSTPTLPLASMYEAARDKRIAIELTNALLARNEIVETNVIADRLVLVHRGIVPALYALRVRFRTPTLSDDARRTLQLIQQDETASAGDVRRFLAVQGTARPDRADLALADLQRDLLVDRGPSSVPERGIPYLSKEGFPYRIFEKAHPDLVGTAHKMSVSTAMKTILDATSRFPARKTAVMFKLCLSDTERREIQLK